MKFKKGVKISGITKECIMGIQKAATIYEDKFDREMVVTSVLDGKHKSNSKHYDGDAFDLRTWETDTCGVQMTPHTKQYLASLLGNSLGDNWDVVVEKTHIHCEYDP
jgi:hypothetical protein